MSFKQQRSLYKSFAVIGLGFGDEGKGLTVNSICKELKVPLVVRFSGGQQAGHTVTLPDGTSHVFSNFGSGTLKGHSTYWTKYCTFDPVGVKREWEVLTPKTGVRPILFVDKNCPVTTPYEKWYNRKISKAMNHGTCGVGVGATYKREQASCSLLAGDLQFPEVVKIKLDAIRDYYIQKTGYAMTTMLDLETFENACNFVIRTPYLFISDGLFDRKDEYVFEGSQGLLLDQNYGFFPHITPSNTGTKNILELGHRPWTFLITRAYQTRHGNGPMTNENQDNSFIKNNPKETNVQNSFQGNFRKTMLDLDLLKYAMQRDDYINSTKARTLVITCLDQMGEYKYTIGGKVITCQDLSAFLAGISYHLHVPNVLACAGPEGIFEEFDFSHE